MPDPTTNPISIQDAEHYVWGSSCDGWHLLKGDDLSVIRERVPPGAFETKHLHQKARQFFYILSGEATIVLADRKVRLLAGHGFEIPPGVAHQFRNDSEGDVDFLVVSSPKSHGDRENVE